MTYANLHTHSVFSDGLLLPGDLLQAVVRADGLHLFALTDHDSLSGIEPMFRALDAVPAERNLRFIAGVEMTVVDPVAGIVHLLGYFPQLTAANLKDELARIDAVLGDYCRQCQRDRNVRDFEGRLRKAFELDLDGIASAHETPDEVIAQVGRARAVFHQDIFRRAGKEADLVRHPIPLTYQDLVAAWEEIVPGSTKERALLYCLRSDPQKIRRMTELLLEDGLDSEEAHALGSSLQGVLTAAKASVSAYLSPAEGLALLKKAEALTSIAHPGVNWPACSLQDFDASVTFPLIAQGLDAIEVFYPYHVAHRDYLTSHYHQLAETAGIGLSGGTDFHGDGRTGLSDVTLDPELAMKLLFGRA